VLRFTSSSWPMQLHTHYWIMMTPDPILLGLAGLPVTKPKNDLSEVEKSSRDQWRSKALETFQRLRKAGKITISLQRKLAQLAVMGEDPKALKRVFNIFRDEDIYAITSS